MKTIFTLEVKTEGYILHVFTTLKKINGHIIHEEHNTMNVKDKPIKEIEEFVKSLIF